MGTPTSAPMPVDESQPIEATRIERTSPNEPFLVRLQYLETITPQRFHASESLVVTTPDAGLKRLPEGDWKVSFQQSRPATIAYSVYVKAFEHHETKLLAEEREQWRGEGYATFVTTMGRAITASDGTVYDGRKYWLGIDRCPTERDALALKGTLQNEKIWAWIRPEVRSPAEGKLSFIDASGTTQLVSPSPARIRSAGPVSLEGARSGKPPLRTTAPIEFELNTKGNLSVCGSLPLESYLQGILPAEMYPDWPLEALKAQAVAARSEIIAHAGGKHFFEGFDFCIEQHCRAFSGEEGHHARTDEAVHETTDQVLVDRENAIVPTVFSANCGGWTEHNENVWDGAPAAALRGHSDQVGGERLQGNGSVESWIRDNPASYCSHDKEYFRWNRSLSLASVSKQLNNQYGIGTLQRVEMMERGVSGRLKEIRLVGSRKSEVVRKELNIRRAFDNLPSALCTIDVDRKNSVIRVRGAGRGHGVGLCQQGACGMAQANQGYDAILQHYFHDVRISRL